MGRARSIDGAQAVSHFPVNVQDLEVVAYFNLVVEGCLHDCHSRAWLPREESRFCSAELLPCTTGPIAYASW